MLPASLSSSRLSAGIIRANGPAGRDGRLVQAPRQRFVPVAQGDGVRPAGAPGSILASERTDAFPLFTVRSKQLPAPPSPRPRKRSGTGGQGPLFEAAKGVRSAYNSCCPAPNTFPGDFVDTFLLSMLPIVAVLLFVLYHTLRRIQCPDCGDTLPLLYSPFKKTRRMWRAGGYLCARCGCETNRAGQKVTADTPEPPFPTLQWALLAVLLLLGIGLGAGALLIGPPVPAPPAAAAPLAAPAPPAVVAP